MSDLTPEALANAIVSSLNSNEGRLACLDPHQVEALLSILAAEATVTTQAKEIERLQADLETVAALAKSHAEWSRKERAQLEARWEALKPMSGDAMRAYVDKMADLENGDAS